MNKIFSLALKLPHIREACSGKLCRKKKMPIIISLNEQTIEEKKFQLLLASKVELNS